MSHDGYSIETTLDPPAQPFLHDHQIDGTPVLPGVMGIEAFAEAALCLLPEWRIEAIEDINFIAPFKFYRSEPRVVRIETRIHPQEEGLVADCRLIGYRSLPNSKERQPTTHFTARVRLTKQAVQTPAARAFVAPVGTCVEAADIYRLYFHGPAYQVVERAWWDGKRVIGLLAKGLPPNHHPSELDTIVAPRLIELCFQTAGIWELGTQGRMGLPQRVRQVSAFDTPNVAAGRLYAVVTPDEARGSFDAEVLDENGNCCLRLSGYQTVALSDGVNQENLKSLQAIMSGEAVLVA
jgi:3-hydroxymyristoyl/3-hydroxydecanoyl-(acyl carrier protein) dehydratase